MKKQAERLRRKPLIEIKDPEIARVVILLIRALHRTLRLRPIDKRLPVEEMEKTLSQSFLEIWEIPLVIDNLGFRNLAHLLSSFPGVFKVKKDKLIRVEADPHPFFPENEAAPKIAAMKTMSLETAKALDQIRGSMALIKVELMECGRDAEKMTKLHSRLSIKQKQLEELLASQV